MLPFFAVAGCDAPAQAAGARKAAKTESCESVSALAAGFGRDKIAGFASGNLDVAIDRAKTRLADRGAKGFTLRNRAVACEDYIDFGGSLGREHKCTASAQLCGKS